MHLWSKLCLGLTSVLLLLLCWPIIVYYKFQEYLPFDLLMPEEVPFIASFMPKFFFFLSIILFLLALITLLIAVFIPKAPKVLTYEKATGQLKVEPKAIASVISQDIHQSGFIYNPKVKIKLSRGKKQLSAYIDGEIGEVERISTQFQQYLKQLERDLEAMFNLDEKKWHITIKLEAPKIRKDHSRVH